MKRRAFLRRAGWMLAALGLGEAGILGPMGDRYHQALAQPTPRKLALLMGISTYAQPLPGCLTDVELHRDLLIHRFGFQPSDVVTLTDQQVTRSAIETVWLTHLVEQVRPGDIVVIHFSGYGGCFQEPTPVPQSPLAPTAASNGWGGVQNSLVLASHGNGGAESLQFLPEETLWLMLRTLATDRIITLLDTTYALDLHPPSRLSGQENGAKGSQRNQREPILVADSSLRSLPNPEAVAPASEGIGPEFRHPFLRSRTYSRGITTPLEAPELAFQDQLLQRLNLTREQLRIARVSGQGPGMLLVAGTGYGQGQPPQLRPGRGAFEGQWTGFSAGLFTAALTQYLWGAAPSTTLQASFGHGMPLVAQLAGRRQQPTWVGQKSQEALLLSQLIPSDALGGADGLVTAAELDGSAARLHLGGLPSLVLEYYGVGSIFQVLLSGEIPTYVQVSSREGLGAKVKPLGSLAAQPLDRSELLTAGQQVQELVRLLPRNLWLTVAIAPELGRIERVDATSAIAAIPDVKTVTTEQPIDCFFGHLEPASAPPRLSPPGLQSLDYGAPKAEMESLPAVVPSSPLSSSPAAGASKQLPNPNGAPRYGLLFPSREPLWGAIGEGGEAVKVAIQRVVPQFQALLATKLLRLTANEGSSRLQIRAQLEQVAPLEQVLMVRKTIRPFLAAGAPPRLSDAQPLQSDGSAIRPGPGGR